MKYVRAICRLALLLLWAAALPKLAIAAELDLKPFRAATCAELLGEYKATQEVNKEALKEMRRSGNETGGSNGLEGTTYASMGFGLAGLTEGTDADSALEELAAYQKALVTVLKEKKCALPVSGTGPVVVPR